MKENQIKPSKTAYTKANNLIKVLDKTQVTSSSTKAMMSKLVKDIKTIKPPVTRYFESPAQLTYAYAESEYDLVSVFKLLKHEPYFLKATQKKHGLLTKSGLSIHSDDDTKKKYICNRFKLMQLETGYSIDTIIKQLALYLIVCSNAFLIKTRSKDPKYGKSFKRDGKDMLPISGLFTVHPTTLKPKFKYIKDPTQKTGVRLILDKWVHTNRRGIQREFNVEDVEHLTLFKEDGMLFGLPEIIPAIDDIRTLRKIEEDIQLLIHRDLFPIIHYTIENPSIIDHKSGLTELDRAQYDMKNIVQDGGIATDVRHKINFIGNEGKGIDVSPYLKYFQQRVFSGLGVSEIDLGIGSSTTNGTADNLSAQIIDSVKFIQQELSQQFKEKILDEMMLQSPYNDIFDEENEVKLLFQEIDIEWKIRSENHEADLYQKGVKTIHETRNKMGHKTIQDEEIDNYTAPGISNKFSMREAEQQAEIKSAAERDSIKASKSNSNIVKHKDMMLQDSIESISIQDEFKATLESIYNKKQDKVNKLDILLATKLTYDRIKSNILDSIKEGLKDSAKELDLKEYNTSITDNIFEKLDRVRDEVAELVYKDKNNINRAAFRVATANKTEKSRGYNYGYVKLALDNNKNKFIITHNGDNLSQDSSLEIGKVIEINNSNILKTIPPFRPNQSLTLKILKETLSDSEKEEVVISTDIRDNVNTESKIEEFKNEIFKLIDSKLPSNKEEDIESKIEKKLEIVQTLINNIDKKNNNIITGLSNKITRINNLLSASKDGTVNISEDMEMQNELIDSIRDMTSEIKNRDSFELDTLKLLVDSMPKTININNPPTEIKLSIDNKEQNKPSKKINVIRDSNGQIISASVEES